MDHPIIRGLGEAANDLVTVRAFCLLWKRSRTDAFLQWSNVRLE